MCLQPRTPPGGDPSDPGSATCATWAARWLHNLADLAAHPPSALPPPRLRRRCSARRARALAAGRPHQPTSPLPRLRRWWWWWWGILPRASVAWVPPPASTATLLPRRRSTSNSLPSSMMTPAEDAVSGRAALAGHSPYSSRRRTPRIGGRRARLGRAGPSRLLQLPFHFPQQIPLAPWLGKRGGPAPRPRQPLARAPGPGELLQDMLSVT